VKLGAEAQEVLGSGYNLSAYDRALVIDALMRNMLMGGETDAVKLRRITEHAIESVRKDGC
jgi:hypothetical protein